MEWVNTFTHQIFRYQTFQMSLWAHSREAHKDLGIPESAIRGEAGDEPEDRAWDVGGKRVGSKGPIL